VNNITPNNIPFNLPVPARQGIGAPRPSGTASALPSGDRAQSALAGVTHGKRKHSGKHPDVIDFETQRAGKKTPTEKSPTEIVKSAIEQSMTKNDADICASLVAHICQKEPVPNNERDVASRKAEVEKLVDAWVCCAKKIKYVKSNKLGARRNLALTLMLKKRVWSEKVTYEQACEELRTVSSLKNPVEYLTKKAQAYCVALGLPELPTEAYGCMVLAALHEELESNGYARADLVDIAKTRSNFGGLLLLASDIMNQPPFTSDSGGDKRSKTDGALSSIAAKVQIARCKGAFECIVAICAHFRALQALGFEPKDILSMVIHHNGAASIEAVLAHYDELKNMGFTPKQIAKIASHDNGASNIQFTVKNADALLKMLKKKKPREQKPRDWIVVQVSDNRRKLRLESALQQFRAEGLGADGGGAQGTSSEAEMESLLAFTDTVTGTGLSADGEGAQGPWTEAEMESLLAFADTVTGTGLGADGGAALDALLMDSDSDS
jgi:hypothetical protein